MVVAYTSANAYIFDIEKSKPVVTLDYKPSLGITDHMLLVFKHRRCGIVHKVCALSII